MLLDEADRLLYRAKRLGRNQIVHTVPSIKVIRKEHSPLQISSEDYSIVYYVEQATIVCQGSLHLFGMQEYQPILNLLLEAIDRCSHLTLDLRGLEFMNSSGINMLMMFVIKSRNRGTIQLMIQGSNQVLWQTRSLRNLQRLMPEIKIEMS